MGQTTPVSLYISIHAPRGGSDNKCKKQADNVSISIHAPRGGSDYDFIKSGFANQIISIHAPRGGSDGVGRIPGA